ncbi:lipoprotein [Amycolatopsis sp. NPDC059657]|uniref:lipoprotein n=1 Tax=Amycolatopsis sp. NPDC059657 TaxID=3346899 RepID=UPI00366A750C
MKKIALLAALFLAAGCGSESTGNTGSADAKPQQAAAGAEIGAAGSACPMPVTFKVAEKWKPKAVTSADARIGDATVICEVDSKPAGSFGFLRVYKNPGSDAQAALKALSEKSKGFGAQKFTDVSVGSVAAKEVSYTVTDDGDVTPKRILAVPVAGGLVLLEVGCIDKETFDTNVKAYELAKSTLKLT